MSANVEIPLTLSPLGERVAGDGAFSSRRRTGGGSSVRPRSALETHDRDRCHSERSKESCSEPEAVIE
jgi:hypothetical protein